MGPPRSTRATATPYPPRRAGDHGQAAVEFAIALPLVVVLVLGIVQVVLVTRDQLAVELSAREGARAAAVAAAPASAAEPAARSATGLRPIVVTTHTSAETVTVDVSHRSTTDVPIIGAFIGDVEVRASVTMQLEPP